MSSIDYEIDLLSKLVEVDTVSATKEGYDLCAFMVAEEAKKASLKVEILDGEKAARDGVSRPNVIVTLDSGSDTTLLLESHFDVVPPGEGWKYPPFKLTIENGKAYGRGAADNKSGIAAALGAMRQLADNEDLDINIKLLASVDEEIGGTYGINYVVSDCGVSGDAALVLDSGPERLFLGASGIIWGKILVQGKQGHAGYPFKAKNAIEGALQLISEFKSYRHAVEKKSSILRAPPDSPRDRVWGRFNITMIKAGEAENIIPGTCEVRFDRRLLPEEPIAKAERELITFFDSATKRSRYRARLEITNKFSGYLTSPDLVFVRTVSRMIKKTLGTSLPMAGELGGNDGNFFAKHNIPVVCFGPIRTGTRYHGKDEFVHLEDLRNVRDFIVNLGKVGRDEVKS
ncbi:MAG: ArgE/DapE family deacylase [Candidatus Bathyarchaeota archaeon]|nr:MAG: ArgE/DapE family deacylase [Candidatus Bathyarchaeota archaeon]